MHHLLDNESGPHLLSLNYAESTSEHILRKLRSCSSEASPPLPEHMAIQVSFGRESGQHDQLKLTQVGEQRKSDIYSSLIIQEHMVERLPKEARMQLLAQLNEGGALSTLKVRHSCSRALSCSPRSAVPGRYLPVRCCNSLLSHCIKL